MSSGTDVVIIGAGVAGPATACYLAKDGVRVTVVEQETLGNCASGYALGLEWILRYTSNHTWRSASRTTMSMSKGKSTRDGLLWVVG